MEHAVAGPLCLRDHVLGDAAAAGRVQQEAIRTHARVAATSVGTLPVLATPTCGALVHIHAGPINSLEAGWAGPVWPTRSVGVPRGLGARLAVVDTPGQALPSAAHFLRPEPGQRRRALASAQLPEAVTEAGGVRVAVLARRALGQHGVGRRRLGARRRLGPGQGLGVRLLPGPLHALHLVHHHRRLLGVLHVHAHHRGHAVLVIAVVG